MFCTMSTTRAKLALKINDLHNSISSFSLFQVRVAFFIVWACALLGIFCVSSVRRVFHRVGMRFAWSSDHVGIVWASAFRTFSDVTSTVSGPVRTNGAKQERSVFMTRNIFFRESCGHRVGIRLFDASLGCFRPRTGAHPVWSLILLLV